MVFQKRQDSLKNQDEEGLLQEDKTSPSSSTSDKMSEVDYHALYLQKTKRNPKVPKGIHVCPICDKTYVYYSQLRQHLQRHALWGCEEEGCDFQYHDKSELVDHLKGVHGRSGDEVEVNGKGPECPICGKTFDSVKAVMAHREVHDASGKYPCKHCGKLFFYWQSRKTHQRACTEVKVKGREDGDVTYVLPGPRIKRIYRRRKPVPLRRGRRAARVVAQPQEEVEVTKVKEGEDECDGVNYSGDELVKGDDPWDPDTPLDLSMKTGRFPKSAFNGGEPFKKLGKSSPKKTSPKKSMIFDTGNEGPVIHKPPDFRQQQEVLNRVAKRKDFLLGIDLRNANPNVVQMCQTAVEQVRQSYFGGYQVMDWWIHQSRALALAQYYFSQQYAGILAPLLSASQVPTPVSGQLQQFPMDEKTGGEGAELNLDS